MTTALPVRLIGLVVALLLTFGTEAKSLQAETGSISGKVTGADGITPFGGIPVQALTLDGTQIAYAFTAADGAYIIHNIPVGEVAVWVNLSWYFPEYFDNKRTLGEATPVTLTAGETTPNINFSLDIMGSISGDVFDAQSGMPVPFANLTFFRLNGDIYEEVTSGTTNINGHYILGGLDTGIYVVSVWKVGYHHEFYQNQTEITAAQLISVTAGVDTAGINMILDPIETGAILIGTVELQGRPAKPDSRWSMPVHVQIKPHELSNAIYDTYVTTDYNGVFSIAGLPTGAHLVWVKHSHTLANAMVTTLVTGNNNVDIGTLREGDANNDNQVLLADFSLLASSFGKQLGEDGYDARADFNLDNAITLPDFSLLASNYGQTGASP